MARRVVGIRSVKTGIDMISIWVIVCLFVCLFVSIGLNCNYYVDDHIKP